jgi:hypothetical protein
MHTVTPETADRIAARWREDAGADNPAGPLFAAGSFAETDITARRQANTAHSLCTNC